MNRMFKTTLAVLACMLMLFVTTVSAAHKYTKPHMNPENGEPCDSVFYEAAHVSALSVSESSHQLRSGYICMITQINYLHLKRCYTCNANLGTFTSACTTNHALCGNDPAYDCK